MSNVVSKTRLTTGGGLTLEIKGLNPKEVCLRRYLADRMHFPLV
jgi:hypothetical protein